MSRLDRTNAVHHLYRCFDKSGRLIYVGTTADLFARLASHRKSAWWAPQVVNVKAVVFPNGLEARIAERMAIREENPRWNVQGRWSTVSATGTYRDLLDYRKAFRALGNEATVWGRKHLVAIDKCLMERGVA